MELRLFPMVFCLPWVHEPSPPTDLSTLRDCGACWLSKRVENNTADAAATDRDRGDQWQDQRVASEGGQKSMANLALLKWRRQK